MNRIPLYIGGGILAATTNATIVANGGYASSQALVVLALSAGVFAGAMAIGGQRVPRAFGLAIIAALVAGEAYNLMTTAERAIVAREASAAPLKDLAAKRQAAIDRLAVLEKSEPSSARLSLARSNLAEARAAVEAEAKDIRCGKECKRKQALADDAAQAVETALPGAVAEHAAAIIAAKAELAANPLPASATPLADRLGWQAWVLDLALAALLSVGANGLAGVLIAFGAQEEKPNSALLKPNSVLIKPNSAFDPPPPRGQRGRRRDPNVVDFVAKFREANGRNPNIPEMRLRFPQLDKATLWRNATAA